ncbi:heat shock protein 70, partial [Tanacetum coccineum]
MTLTCWVMLPLNLSTDDGPIFVNAGVIKNAIAEATKDAGVISGFNVMHIINELNAAASAYSAAIASRELFLCSCNHEISDGVNKSAQAVEAAEAWSQTN